MSFYPPTDYTQTREERRATNAAKDEQLPAMFTKLFDDSYLYPPTLDLANPLLSPGLASKEMLADLPQHITIIAAEYDMLLAEAEKFRDRLVKEIGRDVTFHVVKGVAHGWDKAPNPFKAPESAMEYYLKACEDLRETLGVRG